MNRSEFEHIIRASAEITKEREFIVIGSQAILGKVPDAPKSLRQSMELDIYPRHRPELSIAIDGAIGELSAFDKEFGVYAHGVAPETAKLPKDWESRLISVSNHGTNGAVAWCLDPHDIAYSKLAAGREKDIAYVTELRRHDLVSPTKIDVLINKTEDPELKSTIQARWRKILMQRQIAQSKNQKPDELT
jgi:hypothetical protein